MKAYLYKTVTPETYNYWLIETIKKEYEIKCRVFSCTDIDWATIQPLRSVHVIDEWNYEEPWRPEHTMLPDLYFEITVCEKYYFPKFSTKRTDFSYQWYDVSEIDELATLLKECIAEAARLGIVLGNS